MLEHKEHFHGSDLELIEEKYGISEKSFVITLMLSLHILTENTHRLGKLSQDMLEALKDILLSVTAQQSLYLS